MSTLATAVKKAEVQNAVFGGWITFHTVSVDMASVSAASVAAQKVTVPGVKTGDMVFAAPAAALAAELIVNGAYVSGTDEVSILTANVIDASTAIDDTAKLYNIMVIHLS